jgi:hypothetical protein
MASVAKSRTIGLKVIRASAVTIALAACAEQNSLPPQLAAAISQSRDPLQFKGHYICDQGTTGLTLQVIGGPSIDESYAIFHFSPIISNPNVASGSYVLKGRFDVAEGIITMSPTTWITRPLGYMALGLNGASSDGGKTFEGQLTGVAGLLGGCSTFEMERTI